MTTSVEAVRKSMQQQGCGPVIDLSGYKQPHDLGQSDLDGRGANEQRGASAALSRSLELRSGA